MANVPWAWRAEVPASEPELQRLREVSPIELPVSYLEMLSKTNGYEGSLSIQPYCLVLHPAEEVLEIAQSGTFSEFFPGLFVIGGNGAGEAIALDANTGRDGRIVMFDMTNIDPSESKRELAPTFDELLSKVVAD
jgi:hypothetical protein